MKIWLLQPPADSTINERRGRAVIHVPDFDLSLIVTGHQLYTQRIDVRKPDVNTVP